MDVHGTYGLTPNKLALLQQAFDQSIASTAPSGRFADAYDLLFAMISTGTTGTISEAQAGEILAGSATVDYDAIREQKFDGGWQPLDGVDQGAWIFLRGVSGVNAGTADDPYSIYAREYTEYQHKVRFGLAPDANIDDVVQAASDAIARSILEDVLNLNSISPNPNNLIPTAFGIATQDADAAVDGTGNDDGIFRDGQIGGWVGNIAFLFLGIDQPFRDNVLHADDSGNAYDALSVIAASRAGYNALGDDLLERAENTQIFVGTAFSDVISQIDGAEQGILNIANSTGSFLNSVYGTSFQSIEGGILASVADFVSGTQVTIGGVTFDLGVDGSALGNTIYSAIWQNIILGSKDDDAGISGTSSGGFFNSGGHDIIHGGTGNDVILGSTGSDLIDGGVGDDALDYRDVGDRVRVVINNTNIGSEADYIGYVTEVSATPQYRDDVFNIETIAGSDHGDFFHIETFKDITLDGGEGHDRLIFSGLNSGVTVNVHEGDFGATEFLNFERFIGTDHTDIFIDGAGEQVYEGRAGDDALSFQQAVRGITVDFAVGVKNNRYLS